MHGGSCGHNSSYLYDTLEDLSKILDVDSHDADPSFKIVDGLDMFMSSVSILYQTIEFISEVG
jgi:hypothetical protein